MSHHIQKEPDGFLQTKYANLSRTPEGEWVRKNQNVPPGNCALHWAAQAGQLINVPPVLVTKENLTIPNDNGYTPVHYLAEFGHLNQLPEGMITEELLLTPDNDAWSALHSAVVFGHERQIPKECWTERTLSYSDQEGLCIFRILIANNQCDCLLGINIPNSLKKFFSGKWLQKNEAIKKSIKNLKYKAIENSDIELF